MTPQTIVEKISESHLARETGRPVRAGDFVTIRPRHVLTHDNSAPVMARFHAWGGHRIHDPSQPVVALDHDIQNRDPDNLAKYAAIAAFARREGVDFYPAGTGIGHQVIVERLYAVPGAFVVAADSHANMYGGVGALGTPLVRADAAAIWATGECWWQVPPTVRVVLEGRLSDGASGKDVIVALSALYPGEVLGMAVEFHGEGVATLGLAERLTIANMTTEWGAVAGWFPVDAVTLAWLAERRSRLGADGRARVNDADLERWRSNPPCPDPGAEYVGEIRLDLGALDPHVAGPDTVRVATPLAEIAARRIAIDKAYLVSCVNSRLEDIEAAAEALGGRSVAAGVEFWISAASREVEEDARARGAWQTLLAAGARPLPPGCGPCIGLGAGLLEPGEVGISATNRNYVGRMGSREAHCYLASPAVVAASAAAGFITGPRRGNGRALVPRFRAIAAPQRIEPRVARLQGLPARADGRLVFLPRDHVDTDAIYPGTLTYRDATTPEAMARALFANLDPDLAACLEPGDVILGGFDFGTGSSREQAVTALQAAGVRLVVAGSVAPTYLRNAFNNGFVALECPGLLRRARVLLDEACATGVAAVIPGDGLDVDFEHATIGWRGETFPFVPLGEVPQALIVAGGLESTVRATISRMSAR